MACHRNHRQKAVAATTVARITKGAEEIQRRKVADYLFGYAGPRKAQQSKVKK
jgi:hypothetical protein